MRRSFIGGYMPKKSSSKQSNRSTRKIYNLSNLDELQLGNTLEVLDHDTGETKTVKVVDRAEISATLAYLIGIDMDKWEGYSLSVEQQKK